MKKLLFRKAIFLAFVITLLFFGFREQKTAFTLLASASTILVIFSLRRFQYLEKKLAESYEVQRRTKSLDQDMLKKLPDFLIKDGEETSIDEASLFCIGMAGCIATWIAADSWISIGNYNLGFLAGIVAFVCLICLAIFSSYVKLFSFYRDREELSGNFLRAILGEEHSEIAKSKDFPFLPQSFYFLYPSGDNQKEQLLEDLLVQFVKSKKQEIESYEAPWSSVAEKVASRFAPE